MPKITNLQGKPVSGQMSGLVEAIVVDNVDPDQLGRVNNSIASGYAEVLARLAMPMAGQERGWMTIKGIDDEVLVSFVRGDINNAIVVGSFIMALILHHMPTKMKKQPTRFSIQIWTSINL